ncbi:YihY/virulence factor BrkB family protein [Exiguobacterium sp. s166]|uniref:YihY/virulence factor BrkB family protein n=1 Tax=Exiguobacterium sp. s166 TaxID=2751204 RepID=UPI001BE51FE9|nr:YihY/virulence factor BrkB family protein [Exiguobacterium sp. s166]
MSLLKPVFARFFGEAFFDKSAQLAYYLMLSLFPFLLFVVGLVSFLPFTSGDVLDLIRPFAPAETYELIRKNVVGIFDDRGLKLASISFLAAFWLASMSVQSLVRSLNDALEVTRKVPFWRGLLQDFGFTVGMMVILPMSLLVPVAEKLTRRFITHFAIVNDVVTNYSWIWFLFRWGLGSLFLLVFFILLYRVLPSVRLTVRQVLPGALFATIAWQAVSEFFSYYAEFGSYDRLYGQLAGIIVLMTWFYLSSVVLMLGGLMNAERMRQKKEAKVLKPEKIKQETVR